MFKFLTYLFFWPIILFWKSFMWALGIKRTTKCLKCGGKKLNKDKPSAWQHTMSVFVGYRSKTLNVCRDCGFSWEDR